jgi:hypothetical protein
MDGALMRIEASMIYVTDTNPATGALGKISVFFVSIPI